MRLRRVRPAVLAVALALAFPAFGQEAAPRREAGAVSVPEASPFEQVVKLWKAGLSEDFIRRKIEREPVVYRLSTDDIIACKAAGVPEAVIEAMLKTDSAKPASNAAAAPGAVPGSAPIAVAEPATVVAATPPAPPALSPEPVAPRPEAPPAVAVPLVVAAPAVATPAASAPAPAPAGPSLASLADRSWEGIVRRSPGVVLFKSPWEQGSLSFREEKLSWRDAGDDARSFTLPAAAIREHFLVCPKEDSSDDVCFEWGVKTAGGEERFRDAGWEHGSSPKPRELFAFFEAIYPDLARAKLHVAKKK